MALVALLSTWPGLLLWAAGAELSNVGDDKHGAVKFKYRVALFTETVGAAGQIPVAI